VRLRRRRGSLLLDDVVIRPVQRIHRLLKWSGKVALIRDVNGAQFGEVDVVMQPGQEMDLLRLL